MDMDLDMEYYEDSDDDYQEEENFFCVLYLNINYEFIIFVIVRMGFLFSFIKILYIFQFFQVLVDSYRLLSELIDVN